MRMVRRAALLAALMSLVTFGVGSAASAAPGRPATTRPGAGLFSVSCPTVSFCLAVGSHSGSTGHRHSLAEEWNGKSWRVLANPPGTALQYVSCTSGTFCAVTGRPFGSGPLDTNEFLTWNGSTWHSHPVPFRTTGEISCGSPFYCAAISRSAKIDAWNGVKWHILPGTEPCAGGPAGGCDLGGVACASATLCMALGLKATGAPDGEENWAELYNGHNWTSSVPPDFPLSSVACTRQGLCMTTGPGVADAHTATAGWTKDTPTCGDCTFAVPAMSCAGLTHCMIINSQQWTSTTWNGSEWTRVNLASPGPRPPGFIDDVSCASAGACMLVGGVNRDGRTTAISELWNGVSWQTVSIPSPSS